MSRWFSSDWSALTSMITDHVLVAAYVVLQCIVQLVVLALRHDRAKEIEILVRATRSQCCVARCTDRLFRLQTVSCPQRSPG